MEAIISFFVLKLLKSGHRNAFFVFYRIAFAGKNHADCRIILKFKFCLIQSPVYTGLHYLKDICFHSRQHYLCFRITETGIIFQNLGSVRSQHQAKENNSHKRTSLSRHSIYCRLINIFPAEFIYLFRIKRTWRKGPHSACIQSLVSVHGAFVILSGSHGTDGLSINKRKHRDFSSCHKFFNDHSISGASELFVLHDLLYSGFRLSEIIADQNALSKSKSVRLENNREFRLCTKIFQSLFRILKILISGSGNIIFFHKILGKRLGAFQNSRIFTWAKHLQTALFKYVYNASYQRVIHSNDRQIYAMFLGKIRQFLKFHSSDIYALCILGNSRIAGCAVNFVSFRAFCHTPCNCMFSSAASYNQYIHQVFPPYLLI